jgi:hypothetical protein
VTGAPAFTRSGVSPRLRLIAGAHLPSAIVSGTRVATSGAGVPPIEEGDVKGVLGIAAAMVYGCGGSSFTAAPPAGDGGALDGGPSSTDSAPAPVDSGATRVFRLASAGAQGLLGAQPFIQLTAADLATDVDVAAIHQDFYGVPWDEFAQGLAPPQAWVDQMDALVQTAVGNDVFLSLQLAGGSKRQTLADKATVQNGQLVTLSNWAAPCYDFATAADGPALKGAYVAYVTWMVQRFSPRYVNVGIELNLFQDCTAAWPAMVDVERAAYDAAKAAKPDTIAFPSIQIDHLYSTDGSCGAVDPATCYEERYAGLAGLKRDRFAVSTYPFLQQAIGKVAGIPADYFTRAGDRGLERTVIAETGWDSAASVGTLNGVCATAITSSEQEELAYFVRLTGDAQAHGMDFVTWWSNRDFEPGGVASHCCPFDPAWCAMVQIFRAQGGSDPSLQFLGEVTLKMWGTMGIRQYDGTPKALVFPEWQRVRAIPLAAH